MTPTERTFKSNLNRPLIGQATAKIDNKNRVALPKKFRSALGTEFIITQGFESSLVLVSEGNFSAVTAATANLPFTQAAARHTNRYLLGHADKMVLDAQGRFLLPSYLKTFAGIKSDLIFVGVGTFIELWDKTKWEKYQEFLAKEASSIAEKLSQGGTD